MYQVDHKMFKAILLLVCVSNLSFGADKKATELSALDGDLKTYRGTLELRYCDQIAYSAPVSIYIVVPTGKKITAKNPYNPAAVTFVPLLQNLNGRQIELLKYACQLRKEGSVCQITGGCKSRDYMLYSSLSDAFKHSSLFDVTLFHEKIPLIGGVLKALRGSLHAEAQRIY